MSKKISLIGAGQISGTLAHLIGIKELELFQDTPAGSNDGTDNRKFYYYDANVNVIGTDPNYGFQYIFGNATEDGIVKPSITPSVFELRNPDADIYGKVI